MQGRLLRRLAEPLPSGAANLQPGAPFVMVADPSSKRALAYRSHVTQELAPKQASNSIGNGLPPDKALEDMGHLRRGPGDHATRADPGPVARRVLPAMGCNLQVVAAGQRVPVALDPPVGSVSPVGARQYPRPRFTPSFTFRKLSQCVS